jgi:hypothetical protein
MPNVLIQPFVSLTQSIIDSSSNINLIDQIKPLLILFEYPASDDPNFQPVLKNIINCFQKIPLDMQNTIIDWIGQLQDTSRYLRYIRSLVQYMTIQIFVDTYDEAKNAAQVLGILHRALPYYQSSVSPSMFYNDALNSFHLQDIDNLYSELQYWLKDLKAIAEYKVKVLKMTDTANVSSIEYPKLRSFISFPYTLTPAVKASILEEDARIQMTRSYRRDIQHAISSGQRTFMPYLVLNVRRDLIVMDTISLLSLGYLILFKINHHLCFLF